MGEKGRETRTIKESETNKRYIKVTDFINRRAHNSGTTTITQINMCIAKIKGQNGHLHIEALKHSDL